MFCSLEEALEDFRQGKFLVLVDAEDREDEGDLITAAQFITAEKVNLMLGYSLFIAGPFAKDTGAHDDANFIYFQTVFNF